MCPLRGKTSPSSLFSCSQFYQLLLLFHELGCSYFNTNVRAACYRYTRILHIHMFLFFTSLHCDYLPASLKQHLVFQRFLGLAQRPLGDNITHFVTVVSNDPSICLPACASGYYLKIDIVPKMNLRCLHMRQAVISTIKHRTVCRRIFVDSKRGWNLTVGDRGVLVYVINFKLPFLRKWLSILNWLILTAVYNH